MEVRNQCNICEYKLSYLKPDFHEFSCNVKYFKDEIFRVWRCPQCKTIHCYDIVNLNKYYSHYFYGDNHLGFPNILFYKRLLKQLTKSGLDKQKKFLDYGCANGIFISYLKERGFNYCYGYDPHSSVLSIRDEKILNNGPFDYILIQDVLEHIENPYTFLRELSSLLKAEGILFIGTPNAENIDLFNQIDYKNEIHVPYHLHIYTKSCLQDICSKVGFRIIHYSDRSYLDIPFIGFNERAQKIYQELAGGTLDDVMGSIDYRKVITSPKLLFYSIFGYALSHKANMSIAVQKNKTTE